MKKLQSVVIVVSDGFGGYGDFLFALKLADQLRSYYRKAAIVPPSIYLITQPTGKEKIITLKGNIEFEVPILTPDELAKKIQFDINMQIDFVIEGPVFASSLIQQVNDVLPHNGQIPLIMIPEYGSSRKSQGERLIAHEEYRQIHCQNLIYKQTCYSGFDKLENESGILLSDTLLRTDSPDTLFQQLDPEIQIALGGRENFPYVQMNYDLSFQYSHDINHASEHFLEIHRAWAKNNPKNQIVFMIGRNEMWKRLALTFIQRQLIADGFTQISFYHASKRTEEFFYDAKTPGKKYLVIYLSGMSHPSMLACTALSGPLFGATGDQSFGEAFSNRKMIVYECFPHKLNFITSYDARFLEKLGIQPEAIETLGLLRNASTPQEYGRLGDLIKKPSIQAQFNAANDALIAENNLISTIVREGISSESVLQKIKALIEANQSKKALTLFIKHMPFIHIFDNIDGKTLWAYAKEHDERSTFVQYFSKPNHLIKQYILSKNEQSIENYLFTAQINPFKKMGEKTTFASLMDEGLYDLAMSLATNPHPIGSQNDIVNAVLDTNAAKQPYLKKLRQRYPAQIHQPIAKLTSMSVFTLLQRYRPKTDSIRSEMHRSFVELTKTFQCLNHYDEKALIGLLLLNKKAIASEYRWFSPKKGLFFGSKLYSSCEDALRKIGIDLKNMTPEEENGYYESLKETINTQPHFLANEYILQSLAKHAHIHLPHIQPLLSPEAAKNLLVNKKPIKDPTVFRSETGIYKMNSQPIAAGAWGIIYTGRYYMLENGTLQVSEPLALKKMAIEGAHVLDKEIALLKQVHPEKDFERFNQGENAYLAMPLFPGVQLDKYLSSHADLSNHERQGLARTLFEAIHALHQQGITHNGLKTKNMLYDPVQKKIHLIDFGCAERFKTPIKYRDIDSSIFAFEMPPEYLSGTQSHPTMDMFSITKIVAEILGVNMHALVNERMERALLSIEDPRFKGNLRFAFQAYHHLGDAFFHPLLLKDRNNPNLEKFVRHYVKIPYDFTTCHPQLDAETIQLLNALQAGDPGSRPSAIECVERFTSNEINKIEGVFNEHP